MCSMLFSATAEPVIGYAYAPGNGHTTSCWMISPAITVFTSVMTFL